MVAPALKKEIVLSVEAELTGHPRDAAEGKWTLRGGIHAFTDFMVPKRAKPNLEISKSDNKLVFIVSRCCFSAFRQ